MLVMRALVRVGLRAGQPPTLIPNGRSARISDESLARRAFGGNPLTNVRQALVAFQWEGSLEAAGGSLTNSPT